MRVGADIQAACRKCAEGRIANVECGECGARHRYRAAAGASPARKSSVSPRGARSRSAARKAKPIVAADPSRPRRPFRTSDTYAVGDRVVHPSFGEGVVQAITGATKVEVLFEVGAKTLVHSRTAG